MTQHARDDYRQTMGHLWQGFTKDQMEGWLAEADLVASRYRVLPPDPRAKGPGLFSLTARGRTIPAGAADTRTED